MTTETISVEALLPTQFQPKHSHRFILSLDGLDAYLVKNVKLPKMTGVDGEALPLGQLEVNLYDPISPNGAQQVMRLCATTSKTPIDFEIKLLDPVGTVIQKWKVGGAVVNNADLGALDYANHNPIVIKVVFDIKTLDLEF